MKKCKTDNGFEGIEWDNPERKGDEPADHLPRDGQEPRGDHGGGGHAVGPVRLLGEAIVAHLEPTRRYHEIMADPAYLHEVLRTGTAEASSSPTAPSRPGKPRASSTSKTWSDWFTDGLIGSPQILAAAGR